LDRIVVDTNIYISAIFWGGKPREIIDLGRDNRVHIFTSLEIENEIAEKLRTKFRLDEEEINQILLDFSTLTVPVKVTTKIEALPDDPEDNKFIECAVLSGANYIVSGDKHLLELKEYSGIKILKASEYLAIFEKKER
jgi:putative PIN family toxin of toxin-antitoxin system